MIQGADVSKWQNPAKVDWTTLGSTADFQFLVARASYGARTADSRFVEFADLAREHGLVFGAYLFYRQIHSVEEQLALFDRQLEKIGGLREGDLFPVLDMENNAAHGDGKPKMQLFSDACRKIAETWRDEYGGVILYYSSYFPEWLGARSRPELSAWMKEPGYYHWLADYDRDAGNPRTPYTAEWHLHQPRPRPVPWYAQGTVDIDVDVVNPIKSLVDLLIGDGVGEDVSDEADSGERDTDDRPGGALGDVDEAVEVLEEAAQKQAEGWGMFRKALEGAQFFGTG